MEALASQPGARACARDDPARTPSATGLARRSSRVCGSDAFGPKRSMLRRTLSPAEAVMTSRTWRGRLAAPFVALLGLLGGGVVALTASTAASAATPVTTEAEFRQAWGNDADVVLGANINLTCQDAGDGESEAVRDVAGEGTLDGQGFTITQTCPENRVLQITGETGDMTISNVTITGGEAVFGTFSGNGGGGIQVTQENAVTIVNTTLTDNFTCEGGGGIELDFGGPFTAINST